MNDPVELFMQMEPKAIQSVRFAVRGGFVRKFQPQRNVKYKGDIKMDALTQVPDDFEAFTGPIKLEVIYMYAPTTSMSKKKKAYLAEGNVIMKPTRPDLQDNLSKGLCDALTGVLWKDDSQIVWVEGFKVYSHKGPGIYIKVTPLEEQMNNEQLPEWVGDFLKPRKEQVNENSNKGDRSI